MVDSLSLRENRKAFWKSSTRNYKQNWMPNLEWHSLTCLMQKVRLDQWFSTRVTEHAGGAWRSFQGYHGVEHNISTVRCATMIPKINQGISNRNPYCQIHSALLGSSWDLCNRRISVVKKNQVKTRSWHFWSSTLSLTRGGLNLMRGYSSLKQLRTTGLDDDNGPP